VDDSDQSGIRRKLVETKEKWAREGRLLTGTTRDPARKRLPPGQREVRDWPVLDLGAQPKIKLETWQFSIDGAVATPATWRWNDVLAQPQSQIVSDIHCVTSWSRFDNHWEGVSARHILGVVRPLPAARHVVFHSFDGYTTNLPLAAFDDDDVLLAHRWEGKPLSLDHGGPVRVVVPKRYFWKSAKWISRVEFSVEDRPGFWEVRGYHNEADPWSEERYS
jgi:DMSO/TMAO reductase YedYZ molybdopterin-dependent catalytic subunit